MKFPEEGQKIIFNDGKKDRHGIVESVLSSQFTVISEGVHYFVTPDMFWKEEK